MNKTKISESQVMQFVLQLLMFVIPFTSIQMTPEQMQAAAGIAGMIAVFTWNQRRKQKADDDNEKQSLAYRVMQEIAKEKNNAD